MEAVEREKSAETHKIEYYRSIFTEFDRDEDGFIDVQELDTMIKSQEDCHDIPAYTARKIHKMADKNNDKHIDFEEFVEMVNHPDLRYYFGRYVNLYKQSIIPRRRTKTPRVDVDFECSCRPPPIGMLIVSIIEIIFFCVDEALKPDSSKSAVGPIAEVFIYDPQKREEIWRFITYTFVHIGVIHLIVNLLVQLLLGTFLEMEHKWWRVLLIYSSGVVAGSLATSIADPAVRLAGASGGVYSLVTAHIAEVILNWRQLNFPHLQLLFFLLITGVDIGVAVHDRYILKVEANVGYAAHFAGAAAGLLVGLNVLRNLEVTRAEIYLWWISIVLYCLLMGTAVVWNLAWPTYFLKGPNV